MSESPSVVPRSDVVYPVRPVEDVTLRSDRPRRSRIISGRNVGLAILLLLGALVLSFWLNVVRPVLEHHRTVLRIEDVVKSLEERCPHDVPEEHWYSALGWTWNAIGNCLGDRDFLIKREGVEAEFARLADELERRAQGEVGPEFFTYYWDEVERLSVYGKWYSEMYRPIEEGRLVAATVKWGSIPESQWPYVSTRNSLVFHRRECPLVTKLSWRERSRHYGSRDDAIKAGMSPCSECNP